MKKYVVPLLCLMVLLSVYVVSQAQEKTTISALKSGALTTEKGEALVGKMVTIEGYYVDDPVPMLVESMELYYINTPIPVDRYIVLTGKGIENLPREKFFGAYVKVVGRIDVSRRPEDEVNIKKFGAAYAVELVCDTRPVIVAPTKSLKMTALPSIAKIEIGTEFDVSAFPFKRDRFAILLSGGESAPYAHIRYWNDLKFMYSTLIKNGFSRENIIVVYKDGQGEDTDMKVNYAASTQDVEKAFKYVKDHIARDGLFFYFSTNHGGGLLIPGYENWGYRIDSNKDEPEPGYNERTIGRDLNYDGDMVDVLKLDEITCLYNDQNELVDDKLASLISPIVCKGMIIVMEQCFSGGNIYDLRRKPSFCSIFRKNNRIVLSACTETEFSWASNNEYDEFSYYFTSALNGATPDGAAVNADLNNDRKISILEAFIYARNHDATPETPQYDDNGDGISHTTPLPQGGDGTLGASTFLQ